MHDRRVVAQCRAGACVLGWGLETRTAPASAESDGMPFAGLRHEHWAARLSASSCSAAHATAYCLGFVQHGHNELRPSPTSRMGIGLSRAREDAVHARQKARQHLKAMLLRHGLRYGGKTAWGPAHERYRSQLAFEHPALRIAFAEYRSACTEAHERVERITAALREQAAGWRFGPVVDALM